MVFLHPMSEKSHDSMGTALLLQDGPFARSVIISTHPTEIVHPPEQVVSVLLSFDLNLINQVYCIFIFHTPPPLFLLFPSCDPLRVDPLLARRWWQRRDLESGAGSTTSSTTWDATPMDRPTRPASPTSPTT